MKPCLLALLFALPWLLVADFTSANRHHPTSPFGNCGPNYDNQTCPNDECCSKWGGCGTSSDYCAPDVCLPEYGRCWHYSPPPPPPSPPPPPVGPVGNCGPEYGYQVCPPNECCSNWGGCGYSFDYCDPSHCQPEYGICWASPPTTPAPESADYVAAEMFDGDSHSLIGKVFDGLGFMNPF